MNLQYSKSMHSFLLSAATVSCLSLATAQSSKAALTFTFRGGSPTPTAGTLALTVTNLTNGTPTDTSVPVTPTAWSAGTFVASGTLSGVSDTDSIKVTIAPYNTSVLTGVNLTTLSGLQDLTKNDPNGWGVQQGSGGDIDADDALTFTFDLSGLPANTGLRLTGAMGSNTGGTGQNIQIVVDGSSATTLTGLSQSGLSIDVTDGDLVAFRESGGGGTNDYRLQEFTFETFTIPEPSSAALAFLGLLGFGCIRRRRN